MRAAGAIRSIPNETVLDPLSRLLTHSNLRLRITGIESLAMIGEDHLKTFGLKCLKLIEPLLSDENEDVRHNANYWYGALKDI